MFGFVELVPLAVGADYLVAMIAALFVVLVVAAGWVILWVLHLALGRISIFGFHPFDFFYNFATDAIKASWGYFAKYVSPFGRYLWSQVMTVWRFVYVATETMAGLAAQIVGVNQASQQGLAQLRAQEQNDVQIIDRYIENAQQEITDNAIFAKTYTDERIGNIYDQLTREDIQRVAGADSFAQGLYNRAEANLAQQIAGVNTTIRNDINGVNTTIRNDVNTINATINRDVQDLTRADATNLRTAENFATNLVSGLNVGALRQTVTALQGQVNQIKTDTTECLDPLCDTVTPNAKRLGHLGDLLKNLEALGVEAIIFALAAECLTNPEAVVEDVSSVVNAVGGPVMREFRDLLGA